LGYQPIEDVWCSPSGHVFAVGTAASGNNTIVTFDGEVWTSTKFGDSNYTPCKEIAGSALDDIYVGGLRILRHFDGVEWEDLDVTGGQFSFLDWCLTVAGRDDVMLSRSLDEVVRRQGNTWTRYHATNLAGDGIYGGAQTRAVWRAPDGDLFCIGDGGVVVRYDF
jgi:hypothetical protein